jgi:hypothetical protein
MNQLQRYILTMATVALVLFLALGVAMLGSRMATAAPAQQEIQPQMVSGSYRPSFASLFSGRVTTATGAVSYGPAVDVMLYDESELRLNVDQTLVDAIANTVTVSLQHSMDQVNWTSTALATAVVTDTTTWLTTTVPIGRYWRAAVLPTNGNPVTVTLAAVLEP